MKDEYDYYMMAKDNTLDDKTRIDAVNSLGEMNTKKAKEWLFTLANDGYVKFDIRQCALDLVRMK